MSDDAVTGEIVPARRPIHPAFLSASGLQRAERCPFAYAMDQGGDFGPRVLVVDEDGNAVDDEEESEESRDAHRGTAIHAFLERVMGGMPRAAALALAPLEVSETCEGINLDALPKGRPEVAYALDVTTGAARELPRTQHRGYGTLGPSEIPGTADLIVPPAHGRGTWLVVDYKTGYDIQTPAADNLQLAFHALCVRALHGVDEVGVAICHIDDLGRHRVDAHVLDRIELDAALERLRGAHAAVEAARAELAAGRAPVVHEGLFCKWCPAKPSCPAYAIETATLAKLEDGWLDGVKRQLANPADASYWWQRIDKAKHVLKEIDKLLRERVQQGPIPLPGGYEVRVLSATRPRFDGRRALAVLRDQFGPEVAEGATTITVTKKSVREACGEDAEAVFAVLAEHGALSTYEQRQVRRVKART